MTNHNKKKKKKEYASKAQYHKRSSLRSADVFPVVASLPSLPPLFFGGREATTGNTSVLRRLQTEVLMGFFFEVQNHSKISGVHGFLRVCSFGIMLIRNHSDQNASKEPLNPIWRRRIH